MGRYRPFRFAGLLLTSVVLLGACSPAPIYLRPDPGAGGPFDPDRIHAVLVNGGGSAAINYQSHVIHLREVLDFLEAAGVPNDQITVFASDGEDPGLDLATRELRPEGGDAWIFDGTPLEGAIGRPMEFVSTRIEGVELQPATREALRGWFTGTGADLDAGDVVFFYVTDHGTRARKGEGVGGTSISLWGKDESLTVSEFTGFLGELPHDVQVVTLMSQCYSGGFANAMYGPDGERPSGRYCGYFSTTHDREAYGCYAENRGEDNIGHSIRFLEGLREGGGFEQAHRFTMVHDHTPDVPIRTSDQYGLNLLEKEAAAQGREVVEYLDELLEKAFSDPARYEPQIRLLDGIGRSFGFASPRSLAEVDRRLIRLPRVSEPLGRWADAWDEARDDLARANVSRFLEANPQWRERLDAKKVATLDAAERRSLGEEFARALGPATREDPETLERLERLSERSSGAERIAYRMDVREAAINRMQFILLEVALDVFLRSAADPGAAESWRALQACEDLVLEIDDPLEPRPREPFPAYAEDLEVTRSLMPAWMGIQFAQADAELREQKGLPEGAVYVRRVYPGSPALAAGIEAGDVILGPPDDPFTEPRQIREWTMFSTVDEPRRLVVLRGDELTERILVPGAHPGRFPELPAPPGIGDPAPELKVVSYRGPDPLEMTRESDHLLFFWATWCVPCKRALPDLMAWSDRTGVPVIAITDESAESLEAFFEQYEGPFPETVVTDRSRVAFLAYGVSGTPTFVRIGADGRVREQSTGYAKDKGIGIAPGP
jgi:thiol-disulfide isomerase/thioredoxin